MAQLVMVAHPDLDWVPGKVVGEADGKLRVLLEDGKVLPFPSLSSALLIPAVSFLIFTIYLIIIFYVFCCGWKALPREIRGLLLLDPRRPRRLFFLLLLLLLFLILLPHFLDIIYIVYISLLILVVCFARFTQ